MYICMYDVPALIANPCEKLTDRSMIILSVSMSVELAEGHRVPVCVCVCVCVGGDEGVGGMCVCMCVRICGDKRE